MREKYLIFVLCILLITVLFFVFTINSVSTNRNKIKELDQKIKTAQEQLNSARIMDQQLSQFALIIDNSLTREASFSFDEINAFKTKIGQMADQRTITINKLSDSNKFSFPGLVETTFNLELEATYVQIGQFISDLESMDNILKIHALDISPLQASDKEVTAANAPNRYRVTLEFSVFKVKREA
ncbi:MAG TPA: type 4a pilus biogenesis protein PilO [Candidatus Cloacimonas sp.]|jgi:Tfp pilus assembly protein PilO|nr:type 4a pilus biogenesis protein PilO [Candidatus Cloacimonas sp.]MDD2249663.1 type 4a pilus biogenesis protein PilO [Candidatus Cloacimonadota bacterium]MCK9158043.1 type 4a pilus biogenesis protein PilO [Candidatus Cloacimonas sp.]MCK9164910.1 type 4a pilus biogenesis protein PilO [Candidatus Cloacimonas sp.]MDD3733634.1 type 4a pilus biogenesis protein PilO [Candidatus Cloacimonadota bacterium]